MLVLYNFHGMSCKCLGHSIDVQFPSSRPLSMANVARKRGLQMEGDSKRRISIYSRESTSLGDFQVSTKMGCCYGSLRRVS